MSIRTAELSTRGWKILLALAVVISSVSCRRACPSNYLEYEPQSSREEVTEHDHSRLMSALPHRRLNEPFSLESPLPWECGHERRWRDLGDGYFPRYIREVICTNSTCWYGHYACQSVTMEMKVLTLNTNNCRDVSVPQEIRRNWIFANVRFSAYCKCSR